MSAHSSKGPQWEKLRGVVIANAGGYCAKCGLENSNHVDHIVPVSRGGEDTLENLQLLCWKCNTTKGDRVEGKALLWRNPYWYDK